MPHKAVRRIYDNHLSLLIALRDARGWVEWKTLLLLADVEVKQPQDLHNSFRRYLRDGTIIRRPVDDPTTIRVRYEYKFGTPPEWLLKVMDDPLHPARRG